MAYITFTEYPDVPGRQYRDVCTDPSTGAVACEVDELLAGETEISADEHARIKAAAEASQANLPAVPEPTPPAPSRVDVLEAVVAALAEKAGVDVQAVTAQVERA